MVEVKPFLLLLHLIVVKRYKKGKKNGRVKKTVLISFAKVICVPMRGVQHMPGDKK